MALQEASGRKEAKLTVCPGWSSPRGAEALESQKGEPEAMSNSGSYQTMEEDGCFIISQEAETEC